MTIPAVDLERDWRCWWCKSVNPQASDYCSHCDHLRDAPTKLKDKP